ncbi:MAG: AAA family ATPase [Candidatus Woesearchaeota archaeon]
MNSFETDPLRSDHPLIDREAEADELLYRVTAGDMVLIVGKRGYGKTQLLKHIIDHFKGGGKVIYVDGAKLSKRLDINELIYKKPKGMILLLDNVKQISKRNNEKIKYAFDEERIRSVVFTTDDRQQLTLTDSILERVNNNIITLDKYSLKTVKEILGAKQIELPGDAVLKRIYEKTGNVKDVLLSLHKTIEKCLEKGKENVTLKDVVISNALTATDSHFCNRCGEELKLIGDMWRCPDCDTYCAHCGVLLLEGEIYCPECGREV